MFKKIIAIFTILLIVGFIFAKVKFKKVASSDFDFPTEQTANLAELVKTRPTDAPKPNVIILLADDLGWADVGYRGSDIMTPNIDRLAKEGMRLDRFYATPFCTPTRAALMTARDPIKLGAAHAVFMAWDNGGISPTERFMPEDFKVTRGWLGNGIWVTLLSSTRLMRVALTISTDILIPMFFISIIPLRVVMISKKMASQSTMTANMQPIFMAIRLCVTFLAPHSPMEAKDEDKAKYPARIDTPRYPAKTYAAMVDSMDQAIGEILDSLDSQGIADNTIVLFFSDNGGFYNFGGVNKPLNGGKLTPYEGGVRVNAVMRWPDVLPPNTVNENVVSVMDVYPSLMTAAGVTPQYKKKIDGIDRWNAVLGSGEKDRGDPLVFTSNVSEYNLFKYGVLDGPWKLVQQVDHQRRTTEVKTEVYNVWTDPNESQDISAEHPGQVTRLTKILDKRLAPAPSRLACS